MHEEHQCAKLNVYNHEWLNFKIYAETEVYILQKQLLN